MAVLTLMDKGGRVGVAGRSTIIQGRQETLAQKRTEYSAAFNPCDSRPPSNILPAFTAGQVTGCIKGN